MNGTALGQPFRDISRKRAHSRREFQRAVSPTAVALALLSFAPLSPHNRTIFEYYRRDRRQPASDAWVLAPSNGFNRSGESDQARYGDGLGATVVPPKQLPSGAPQSGSFDYARRPRDNDETPGQVYSAGRPDVLTDSLAKLMQLSVSGFTAHAPTVSSADALALYIAQHGTRTLAPGLIWSTLPDIDIAHSGAFSLLLAGSDRSCVGFHEDTAA
jgi:hypothetical protein